MSTVYLEYFEKNKNPNYSLKGDRVGEWFGFCLLDRNRIIGREEIINAKSLQTYSK